MTKRFTPQQPHGVLFDRDGKVVLRFGAWRTDMVHRVPDYVEMDRDPVYVDGPAAHSQAGYALERHPSNPSLPDPTDPPEDESPVSEFR